MKITDCIPDSAPNCCLIMTGEIETNEGWIVRDIEVVKSNGGFEIVSHGHFREWSDVTRFIRCFINARNKVVIHD